VNKAITSIIPNQLISNNKNINKQKLFSPQLACCSSCAASYLFYNCAADAML
jgi:hypothetical protein